ncbi:carboxyl-terminal-processing peptidase 2, chloroplastic isoform X2 [Aristolochia californica]|uniref:carboxyl-terminal-processing peptidase 2, chloroplastic isoform X2 n=1 Tax=Aristolochia californica TaxID=171875 RepID=UPI0035DFC9DE
MELLTFSPSPRNHLIVLTGANRCSKFRTPVSLLVLRNSIFAQVLYKFQKTSNGIKGLKYNVGRNTNSYKQVKILEEASMSPSFFFESIWRAQSFSSRSWSSLVANGTVKLWRHAVNFHGVTNLPEKFKSCFSVFAIRLAVSVLLVMSAFFVSKAPTWALSEENLLFLEAWRTIDRAYYDKTFNGQSWFRYRETALRAEPMNTREETYAAIKKMLATLDDPFTRFLEPEKFRSLRSGTQGALTGVGLSIGYPTGIDGSDTGLVVISSAEGGPAYRAGILPGDVILSIDQTSTETMGLYDAAERLQGPEGTSVELGIHSGPEMKQIVLKREKVSLNPVKSRLCEVPGAVKEAIETLRRNNVSSFVLDLRNNSGGLFPEGIEIAKIWLEKGVIVYICDSRGVRDIYETDGSNALAPSEPLVVLVNKGTASASEILAGALKDNKRAILYGEPTYGKGKIQSVFELSDGSGLAVTVARYETPAHTDIDKVGVTPDHPLPASFPLDEEGFCRCVKDSSASCNLSSPALFSR